MQMKEHMYRVFEENSDRMQVNLQELQEVLDSCTKFSDELLEANRALACLREGDMPWDYNFYLKLIVLWTH